MAARVAVDFLRPAEFREALAADKRAVRAVVPDIAAVRVNLDIVEHRVGREIEAVPVVRDMAVAQWAVAMDPVVPRVVRVELAVPDIAAHRAAPDTAAGPAVPVAVVDPVDSDRSQVFA